jgi:hypothetical protein
MPMPVSSNTATKYQFTQFPNNKFALLCFFAALSFVIVVVASIHAPTVERGEITTRMMMVMMMNIEFENSGNTKNR